MPSQIEPREKTEKLSAEDSKRHEFVRDLAKKIREDDDARETWKNKQITANNARLGIRRQTNRPWPGYREVPIPATDKTIRKTKSMFVSVATRMKNPIVVTPESGVEQPFGDEQARTSANKIRKALNGLIAKRDFQWRKKVALFADYFLENGIALFKVIEKFNSQTINRAIDLEKMFGKEQLAQIKRLRNDELRIILAEREGFDLNDEDDKKTIDKIIKDFRSGKKVLKFTKTEVTSEPNLIPERGINVIVPNGATDVQTSPRITHNMWMPFQEIRKRAAKGIYDKKAVEDLDVENAQRDDSLNALHMARNEGVDLERGQGELFNVREAQTWYEVKKNEWEKWVFTWVEKPTTKGNDKKTEIKVIQEQKFPYEHGMWTWVKHDNELKSQRWHASRGVPEQIRGLQQVMDRMYNNRLIRDEINNNPMVRVDPAVAGQMGGNEIRFKPGQGLIAGRDQVEIFNRQAAVDVSSERLEQQSKAYLEEYQAIPDFTINNAANPGSGRTKGEIEIANSRSNQVIGTDVALFLETLSETAWMMYLILKETVVRPTVIGGVLLTPEDFLTKVNVSWSGSVEATDVDFQMQKALSRLQVLFQFAAPSGLMGQENIYNALRSFLEKDPDVEDPDQFITKPAEAQISEIEDQQLDIMRMKNGFDVQVRPDENHSLRIDVTEAFINDPRNQQLLKDRDFLERLRTNIAIHTEAEQQLMGGNRSNGRVRQIARSLGNGQAA